MENHGSLWKYAGDTLIYLLLLCIGFEMAAYISFVHPVLNRYTLFLTITIVAAGITVHESLKAYEMLISENYYKPYGVLVNPFNTYSRYSGPREAIFTALCRKNYG